MPPKKCGSCLFFTDEYHFNNCLSLGCQYIKLFQSVSDTKLTISSTENFLPILLLNVQSEVCAMDALNM